MFFLCSPRHATYTRSVFTHCLRGMLLSDRRNCCFRFVGSNEMRLLLLLVLCGCSSFRLPPTPVHPAPPLADPAVTGVRFGWTTHLSLNNACEDIGFRVDPKTGACFVNIIFDVDRKVTCTPVTGDVGWQEMTCSYAPKVTDPCLDLPDIPRVELRV